jgi:predicted nucleic acid-binding protein
MIFVDANVFLRHLIQPSTIHDRIHAEHAARLFKRAEDNVESITTSEAILAEVVFILSDSRHYNFPRSAVQVGLQSLLRARGLTLPTKDVCRRALDIWVERPRLSFPDALGAAYSDLRGYDLATFDMDLSRTPGVTPHVFRPAPDEA